MKCTQDPVAPARASHRDSPGSFSALPALQLLVRQWLVPKPDLLRLPAAVRRGLIASATMKELVASLTEARLLTPFQAGHVLAGTTFGLILGQYRVLEPLAGRGLVYRGEHRSLRLPVAINLVPSRAADDVLARQRFHAELAAVARINHPSIARILDPGGAEAYDADGTVLSYFVTEYPHGHDLEQHLRLHGLPEVDTVCRWGMQLAAALAAVQRHRRVHGAMHPASVLITHEGRAKLLDFGLAPPGPEAPGDAGDYRAPEQLDDLHGVDGRADLYGLGGVLYWALTGRRPFGGRGSLDGTHRVRRPPPPRAVRPDLPRGVDLLVRRLMMERADDRFDSPLDVVRILRPFAEPRVWTPMPEDQAPTWPCLMLDPV